MPNRGDIPRLTRSPSNYHGIQGPPKVTGNRNYIGIPGPPGNAMIVRKHQLIQGPQESEG